jgi:hypothetical protein
MSIPNRAVRMVAQKNQRNGGPVCNGAPFNVIKPSKPSNDVEIENVGLNGLKPMVVSKKASPQRPPPDEAVAMENVSVVVPVARFTSRIMAGVNNATKKFKLLCAGSGATSSRLGNISSALGANVPRGRDDDDILGHRERVFLLPPSAAAAGGVPATPVVGTPSIEKMTTFDHRGQSLPHNISLVDEIESKNKNFAGHVNGSKRFESFLRCTARWTMVLSLIWLCTFIVNVDSYNPLPSRHGCCDDGNILIDASSLILYCGCLCNVF